MGLFGQPSGGVGHDAANVLGLAGRADFAERPTVSYAIPNQDVIRGFLTPLTTETLFVLSFTGSPAEEVLNVVVQSLNKVENAIAAGGPTPREAPEFQEFRWLEQNLRKLRQRKQVEVGRLKRSTPISDPVPRDSLTANDFRTAHDNDYEYKPSTDGKSVVLHKRESTTYLRFDREALDSPEYMEIVRLLHLAPGRTQYELKLALEGQLLDEPTPSEGRDEIQVSIRSLLEVMFYLSNGVEVPSAHVADGVVRITKDARGCPFDWQQVLGNRFVVRVSKTHPHRQRFRSNTEVTGSISTIATMRRRRYSFCFERSLLCRPKRVEQKHCQF